MNDSKRRRSRLQIIMVALVFLGPLLVAGYMYFGPEGWRPIGKTNNGELIQPVVVLPVVSLAGPDGTETASDFLKGRWSIVYLNREDCEQRCRETLIQIRQIRLAAGSESHRLQRVFLSADWPDGAWLAAGHTGLLMGDPSCDSGFSEALRDFDSGLYLVDPLGNLMMRYPLGTESKPIYKDLKKLLKYSRIG